MYIPRSRLINFRYRGPKESAKINYMLSAVEIDLQKIEKQLNGFQEAVEHLGYRISRQR